MNEEFARIGKFLLIFWTGLIILNITFSPWINQFTNIQDLKDLNGVDDVSILEIDDINLYNIMFFKVTEIVPFWISIILDLFALFSLIIVISFVFNR